MPDPSATPMKSSEALAFLGVEPDLLSAEEWNFLDENGYLLQDGILSDDELLYLRKRLDGLAEIEGENAGSELHREEGTVRLANLLDKDPLFEKFITTPPRAGRYHPCDRHRNTTLIAFEPGRFARWPRPAAAAHRLARSRLARGLFCLQCGLVD